MSYIKNIRNIVCAQEQKYINFFHLCFSI